MPRRKQKSILDEWHDVFVAAPWWVPLVIAAVAYVGVRLVPGFAPLAPSAAMCVLVLGLLAQLGKAKRRNLLSRQTGTDTLRAMNWQEFELLVGEAFRRQGYAVQERGGGGPDGGVDLVLRRGMHKTLVQCKHWRVQRVGVSIVRELYGVMASERAHGGIVVNLGEFTPDAREFARGKPLELINGTQLLELVRQAQTFPAPAPNDVPPSALAPPPAPQSPLPAPRQWSPDAPRTVSAADEMPFCPRCGGMMTVKTARKGPNAGGQFWGCAAFPQCRGIRNIDA